MNHVIVTGACGGIGRAVTEELLRRGYGVWATGRDAEQLRQSYGEDARVRMHACDLAKEESVRELIRTVVEETGPVAGLVHCAGHDKLSPLYLNKRADVEALFAIHVYAAMDLCKYIAKRGNALPGCSIVLISSLAAHEGAKGHTAYAAAKGALEGFLPSAACELAERGIRLNEVVLGVVRTKMSMGYIGRMDAEQERALEQSYPLGLGRPEDVAGTIANLMGSEARWITGQKIILDGGHMIRSL